MSRKSSRGKKRNPADILKDFYNAAWPVILNHYLQAVETSPGVQEDTRNQGTQATLIISLYKGTIIGSSGNANIHAENQAYNEAWEQAKRTSNNPDDILNYFDTLTAGGSISCDGHKASCFMCAAIAHNLVVQVEHKDPRGFTQYNLPNIFRELPDPYFKDFVGDDAYIYFQELGTTLNGFSEQSAIFTSLGSRLYKEHMGSNANFKLT